MNAKKQRDKNRRRARKLADQAWDTADEGNFNLAGKIIRRAVDLDPSNPMLWHDQGLLLRELNDDDAAAESFQAAISLAPDYAESYANLSEIRIRQGNVKQAIALGREAVKYAPQVERYQTSLTAYEAMDGKTIREEPPNDRAVSETNRRREDSLRQTYPEVAHRVDELNWPALEESLTGCGYIHIPQLLQHQQCADLRTMFADDLLFSKTVKMDKSRFGKGTYRYFNAPIPSLIDAIRQIVYPYVSQIGNTWQQLLQREEFYPPRWEEFRQQCADVSQTTPTPLLLKYETGGFNAPHQDIRGEIFFPIQLVIILSQLAESSPIEAQTFTGGEFLFVDQPERKKTDRHKIPAGLGDAVLFCTQARLVRVAGIYGLKSVKHGMDEIKSGTRYALGIPFHEFA